MCEYDHFFIMCGKSKLILLQYYSFFSPLPTFIQKKHTAGIDKVLFFPWRNP